MKQEPQETREERHERIRRVKRILRPLPRRANIHKYPVIKYFAKWAHNRPYLWSLKPPAVIPALYVGSILSFMPLMSIQTPLAFLASLIFRCNLTITVALQFITNPLTAIPIYALAYKIGRSVLDLFGAKTLLPEVSEAIAAESHRSVKMLQTALNAYWATTVGGILLGAFFGLIFSLIYQFYVYRKPEEVKKP